LRDVCLAYGIPLLSGKDSMYVDGNLAGRYGISHKVSAPETIQFSAISRVPDIAHCTTMDVKVPGDLVYLLGLTRDELGGSEYYEHLGYVGRQVPEVHPETFQPLYRCLQTAIADSLTASVRGIYRGGLAVHAALAALAGGLGLSLDLSKVPLEEALRDDKVLFSESAGRFLVTVAPDRRQAFEAAFDGHAVGCIGVVTEAPRMVIRGTRGEPLVDLALDDLKIAWKAPFGDLV
jgi:phosphoribosylformylglycinamidine synthase